MNSIADTFGFPDNWREISASECHERVYSVFAEMQYALESQKRDSRWASSAEARPKLLRLRKVLFYGCQRETYNTSMSMARKACESEPFIYSRHYPNDMVERVEWLDMKKIFENCVDNENISDKK